jgi:hypothetical protein
LTAGSDFDDSLRLIAGSDFDESVWLIAGSDFDESVWPKVDDTGSQLITDSGFLPNVFGWLLAVVFDDSLWLITGSVFLKQK